MGKPLETPLSQWNSEAEADVDSFHRPWDTDGEKTGLGNGRAPDLSLVLLLTTG